MSDDEKELTKEERLEAARRKYEELKKKKKKGKKKTKKDGADESPAPEDEVKENEEPAVGEGAADVEDSQLPEEEAKLPETGTPEVSIAPSLASQEDVSNPPLTTTSTTTQHEVEELRNTIEQQTNTIKKLRDENTDLKLAKMDLDDKVAELEAQVAQLRAGKPELVPTKKIEPAKPVITSNVYADETTDFANFRNDDFREKLMLWKGWQVDMTQWQSPYTTQQVQF